MLQLFIGEDTFRSRAAYHAAQVDASRSAPLLVLRDEGLTVERLVAAFRGQPLFGLAPVVAVEELATLSGSATEVVIRLVSELQEDRHVLIWERGVPDRRLRLWKALEAHADRVETFAPLTESALVRWVEETVRDRGGTISRPAVQELLRACGMDLWTLSTEIDKLLLFAREREVSPDDVRDVTPVMTETQVFATVRALATGDGAAALRALAVQRARGEDPRGILALTLRELRTLLVIRDRLDRRSRVSAASLAREFHVPLFVAEALLRGATRTTTAHLRGLFDRLVVSLYSLNTGRAEPDDVLDSLAFQALGRTQETTGRTV